MNANDYYIGANGERRGPFVLEQLREQHITAATPVWKPGFTEWKAAGELPELRALIAERERMTLAGILDLLRRRPSYGVLGMLLIVSILTVQWPFGTAGTRSTTSDKTTTTAATNSSQGLTSNTSKAPSTSSFPLTWQKLLQLTGEGPNTRKYHEVDGRLRRIESRYGIQVLVAVEAVGDGFAVALANEFAVADFISRHWFTAQETQSLQNLYAEFVTDYRGSKQHRAALPRFEVTMRRDSEISSYACFEFQPRSN